jgi:hypothetical protein
MSLSLSLTIVVIVGGAVVLAGTLTLGVRRIFPGRDRLLTDGGGSSALRAVTATYGLLLAFVLGASLTSFNTANQQTVAEADTVVSLSNLSQLLPTPDGPTFRTGLVCYASTVVNHEFPAMKNGDTSISDDDAALNHLYRVMPEPSTVDPRDGLTTDTMIQQLSNLANQRGSRIRAAGSSLPTLLWIMLIGGGVIVLLALTAMTYADRVWAQFSLLTAVAAIILSAIFLIATLQKPFQSDAIKISAGPMTAALATVQQGLPPQSC